MKIDKEIEAYKIKLIQEYHSREWLLLEYRNLSESIEMTRQFIKYHNIKDNDDIFNNLGIMADQRNKIESKILDIFRKDIDEYENK